MSYVNYFFLDLNNLNLILHKKYRWNFIENNIEYNNC